MGRLGYTPLDDAVRRGNAVAALALKRAGGLQSTDPRMKGCLDKAKEARINWWRHARKMTVEAAIESSPEVEIWRSAEERALPPLKLLIQRIEESQNELELFITIMLKKLLQAFQLLSDCKSPFFTIPENDVINHNVHDAPITPGQGPVQEQSEKEGNDFSLDILNPYMRQAN